MKSQIKTYLAAISLAIVSLGSLLIASPAMAYTPKAPCVSYPSTPAAHWPGNGHFFNCTGNTADVTMIQIYNKAYQNTTTFSSLSTKFFLFNMDMFVFPNVSDYDAYPDFASNVALPPNGGTARGFSISTQGANHPAPVIAVFTVPSGSVYAQRVTNHELGHALDFASGNEGSTSNSTWRNYLLQDFIDLDALGARNFPGFTAACNTYPKNSDRLLCMEANKPNTVLAEQFAEEFATLMAGSGPFLEADSVITNYFTTNGSLQNPHRPVRSRDYVRGKF